MDEDTITSEILWLCYQLDMGIHPLDSTEAILCKIKRLVEQRDRLRETLHDSQKKQSSSS